MAGATGGVGGQIVRCLRASGVKVRALVRDYTKAVGLDRETTSMQILQMCTHSDTFCLQSSDLYTDGVEVVKGDVYQYATLPASLQKW